MIMIEEAMEEGVFNEAGTGGLLSGETEISETEMGESRGRNGSADEAERRNSVVEQVAMERKTTNKAMNVPLCRRRRRRC
jgi:hypothetical protein